MVTYLQYTAGSNKGATKQGDVFNSVFGLGAVDQDYTSARVVETVVFAAKPEDAPEGTPNYIAKLAWRPTFTAHAIVGGSRSDVPSDDSAFKTLEEIYWGRTGIQTAVRTPAFGSEAEATAATATQKGFADNNFRITDLSGTQDWTTLVVVNAEQGIIGADTQLGGETGVKVAYIYDNQVIPQQDLPLLNANMQAIPLVAHARRIAIYYSQIAAFQAKQDYGFDLGDQLAEKAVGQLRYEIDTEICDGLISAAGTAEISWNRALPTGVSKAEHYEGFSEAVEVAKQKIYDRTKRFIPNYMLIASDILPILGFIKGFQAAPVSSVNGPYFAGTLNGLKVFVTPNIKPGKFVVGVNGDDMMTSAAVYAVYMPVVPTQLLQYADGGTSQGFSTLYDFKILNANLLVAGEVTGQVNDFQVLQVHNRAENAFSYNYNNFE